MIPVALVILSIISYYTNSSIEKEHLITMISYIFILTILLFLFAWCISWKKIEIHNEKVVIKRVFQKQEIFFHDIKRIIEDEIEGKQGKVKTICIETRKREVFHFPSKPFEKSKTTILQLIKKESKKKD